MRPEGIIYNQHKKSTLFQIHPFFLRTKMAELLMDILKTPDSGTPDRRILTKLTAQLSIGLPDPYIRVETVVNLLTDLYNPFVNPQKEPEAPTLTDDQKRAMNVAVINILHNAYCSGIIAVCLFFRLHSSRKIYVSSKFPRKKPLTMRSLLKLRS
jgi:hypothetical protein